MCYLYILDVISKFNKVVEYEINIQKLMTFLYTNNELLERESKKKNPTYYSNKENKVPGNKFNHRCERPVLR